MKVAIVNTWMGGAVHHIMYPLHLELLKKSVDSTYLTVRQIDLDPSFDRSFADYDIVHFGYFANIRPFVQDIEVPFTCGVHHLHPQHLEIQSTRLQVWGPRRIVVPEPFVRRQLAQMGLLNTVEIPYAFDHSRFTPLPYPDEFTVGYLGCDYESKRFRVIEEGAAKAGVPCKSIARDNINEEVDYQDDSVILDFYKSISCYVVAGFNEGGPLPPQEALLCGRPVITTHVGMMPIIVSNYSNGKYFDGTAKDLAKKIKFMKDNFDLFATNAAKLAYRYLPTVGHHAHQFKQMFEEVLEEEG